MIRSLAFATLIAGLAFAQSALGQGADTLYFSLDLRGPLDRGWLDPGSETVGLRGDHPPLSWGATYPASDETADGYYEVAVPIHVEGDSVSIAFKVKVDGEENPNDGWQTGPNHVVTYRKNRPGFVAVAWDDLATPASTITGTVEAIHDVSADSLLARDVFVYLPPGYDDTDRRYPVLYMHDGQNVFDAAAAGQEWRMDEAAEELIPTGKVQPVIIVAVGNTSDRLNEYTPTAREWNHELRRVAPPDPSGNFARLSGPYANPQGDTLHVTSRDETLLVRLPEFDAWQPVETKSDTSFHIAPANITLTFEGGDGPAAAVVATKQPEGGKGDRYGRFLVEELKPLIDERYRTRGDGRSTGLGGSSLGGLITLHIGLRYPDVFGRLLVVSPSVWWDDRWIVDAVRRRPAATQQSIWLDVGTSESGNAVADTRQLRDALLDKGWSSDRLRYVEAPDADHSERAWAKRVPAMLQFLYPTDESP